MTGKMYGYARVSSKEQNLNRQLDALAEFGVADDMVFADKASGKTSSGRNTNGLFQRFAKTTWSWLLGSGGFSHMGRNYHSHTECAFWSRREVASPAQSASFREVTGADCAFTRGRLRRMRLCVRWLRVCAGEEKRTLRKGAF